MENRKTGKSENRKIKTRETRKLKTCPPLHWLHRPSTWLGAYALWFVILTILSSLSKPGPKIEIVGFDKIAHTTWFMLGGAALALSLRFRRVPPLLDWLAIALFVGIAGSLVGWLDEWHQSYTPGRQGLDVYDWIADVLGSFLSIPFAWCLLRLPPLRADRP